MSPHPLLRGWKIQLHSGIPAYKQIANRLTSAMADGTLKNGDRLPTIRELNDPPWRESQHRGQGLSRTGAQGPIIDGQRGFGSFVKLDDPVSSLPEPEKGRSSRSFTCGC